MYQEISAQEIAKLLRGIASVIEALERKTCRTEIVDFDHRAASWQDAMDLGDGDESF
jgi:hypothetical protein